MFKSVRILTVLYGCLKLHSSIVMASTDKFVKRLGSIEGTKGKFNDVIYHPAKNDTSDNSNGKVVYFGGDVQDYPENMAAHRDNKHYLSYNLEITTSLLSNKFPDCHIYVIRPTRMPLKTFSCFDNFVNGDEIGSPNHEFTLDSLKHLKSLMENIPPPNVPNKWGKIFLIGFSKGCVVLNQFLYSLKELDTQKDQDDLLEFSKNIECIYWLDGGHSGGSNTWITDKNIIKHFVGTKIKARIHVTPYQMQREARPWVGKEEKIFRDNLRKFGADIERKIHFDNEPASLYYHFKVLEVFQP